MAAGETPQVPQIDVANIPLAFLPHGINTGDTFTVEVVGRNEDEAVVRVAPTAAGVPQAPISGQTAQAMPLAQLQSYLQNQQQQRNVVNPSLPVNPLGH
jgi:hypothetical protein